MAKLTRYTSFRKLKASSNSINRTSSRPSIEMSEFEEFINLLKKAASKKTAPKKKGQPSDGQ